MWDDLDDECFFIAPIGEEGSPERERSDGVRDFIVKPAAAEAGIDQTIRADDIAKPGQITLQVIERVLRAKAAVVDLTGANANVYYEMAIRHTARLPTVLIAGESERGKLPFDLQGMRAVFFDHTSLKSADTCRRELASHLAAALEGAIDSPVVASVNLKNLESGDAQGQVLASLVTTVDVLAREVRAGTGVATAPSGRRIDSLTEVVEDLERANDRLEALAEQRGDAELQDVLQHVNRPYGYLAGFIENQDMLRTRRRRRVAAVRRAKSGETAEDGASAMDNPSPSSEE